MKLLQFTISVLCALLLGGPCQAKGDEKGWVLKQRLDFIGPATTYITSQATKVDSPRLTITLGAPDWRVIISNKQTKCYSIASYSGWLRKFIRVDVVNLPAKYESTDQKIGGVKLRKYLMIKKYKMHKSLFENFEVLATYDIKTHANIVRAFNALYELPETMDSLPLRVHKRTRNRREGSTSADTFDCKQAVIPQSIFKIPNGYKKVNNEMEVLFQFDSDDEHGDRVRSRMPTGR